MSSKELNTFRKSCRNFLEQEAKPLLSKWENDGFVSRDFWLRMGNAGLLGINVPQQWGGHGKEDYNFSSVLTEELIRSDMVAPVVIAHNDVITSYIYAHGTDKQRERWLPKLCRGELIAAIAITEPNGGSDSSDLETTADKHGDYYIVNGKKSFITNGFNADLILTAVKTSKSQRGRETSLLIIENDTVGFMKEKPLKKLGWHASDTANLHFSNCHVSISNLIGNENMGGFYFIGGMPRERLSISTVAVSTSEIIIEKTLEWVKNRLATVILASNFQVLFFPAMGEIMWNKPAMKRNIIQLQEDGYEIITPVWHESYDTALGKIVRHPSIPSIEKVIDILIERLSII